MYRSSDVDHSPVMFGSHLSISGGMHNALLSAEALGFDTVQVFTKNQQQWVGKPLDPGNIAEWKSQRGAASNSSRPSAMTRI